MIVNNLINKKCKEEWNLERSTDFKIRDIGVIMQMLLNFE